MEEPEIPKFPDSIAQPLSSELSSVSEEDEKPKQDNSEGNSQNHNISEIPEALKQYITEDIWNMWSSVRRESYIEMLDNPNKFFYRNRPPGELQKNGAWSPEENAQFRERLTLFQRLNIIDTVWGLFAVPIKGRLGYQCANYYRSLLKDGKLVSDRYSIVDGKLVCNRSVKAVKPSPSVLEALNKEAIDYIKSTMHNGAVMDKPLKAYSSNNKTKTNNKKTNKSGQNKNSSSENEDKQFSNESSKFQGKSRHLPDKHYNQIEEHLAQESMKKSAEKQKFFPEDKCPITGYPDPITGKPMKTPMIDPSGFVMDSKSWKAVFNGISDPPQPILAKSIRDLVVLNEKNFDIYRLLIVNIPC